MGARGYLAVSSGTITDEMIREYIEEQEGEQIVDDSRFSNRQYLTYPRLQAEGRLVCAEHVRQLEGESPFHNLMEVK